MGSTVCDAVAADPELEVAAAVDPNIDGPAVQGIEVVDSLDRAGPFDVAVDFTVLAAAKQNAAWCAEHGVHAVIGTTGFTDPDFEDLRSQFTRSSCLVAPNFAVGAVLMMRFAELAAPLFETAEIIELHHDAKFDAPSGTAMATARRMAEASPTWGSDPTRHETVSGSRGGIGPGGIRVHAVRLRGLVAHQEVILGTLGQSLTIRHDSYDRTSFMPGVLLAVKHVGDRPGLTVGLETLLGV
jgi:4-hydroxy-tetrahydrodipicolinate reductase